IRGLAGRGGRNARASGVVHPKTEQQACFLKLVECAQAAPRAAFIGIRPHSALRCCMFSIMLRPLASFTATLSLLTTVLAIGFGHQSVGAAPLHFTIPYAEAIKGDNPVAAPGPVKWHKSYETAKATSLKTGKPVLLFHLGQTDKKACGAPPVGVM